jgi:hypothetical protein
MKFSKLVFLIAGIYGLIVLVPQYFLEARVGRDHPPAITHPEFFYGFIGVGVAWQVVFLIISRNPPRYRTLMLAAIIEKASFGIAAIVLFLQSRLAGAMLGAASIDLVLGVLFALAYIRTPVTER